MNLTIHPEAAKNCKKKAEDLLQQLQRAPERFSRERGPSNPDIHSTFTFTPENTIGEMIFGWSDFMGNTVAKAFQQGNEYVGLFEDDYIKLIRVAEAIHKNLRPRVVTVQLLTNLVFDWVKEAHRKTIEVSMTDYVLQECEKVHHGSGDLDSDFPLFHTPPICVWPHHLQSNNKSDDG